MIAVIRLSMVMTFIACISIFLAPCIVTYWRYGRWLGAVNCPVCRQQVSEQNGPRKGAPDNVILRNLHLKSSAKNGGSNWVLIQRAIFTVSIVISRLLSLPPRYLESEVGKKA